MGFQFPIDGSIVIIDDQFSEAKPLIDMLSENGSSSVYYSGDLDSLPDKKLAKVRLIFADIQLLPNLSADNYASLIVEHIERLVSNNNGPYVLIIWSGTEALFSDRLIERVNSNGNHQKPIQTVTLAKNDYYKNVEDEYLNTQIKEIIEELDTRFDGKDLLAIKEKLEEKLIVNEKKLNEDALSRISRKITAGLKKFKSFQLLLEWESSVYEASSIHVSDLSCIHNYDENWDGNFKNLISRMAYAQNEQSSNKLKGTDLLNATFKTINNSFNDTLNSTTSSKIKNSPWKVHDFKNSDYSTLKNNKTIKIKWNNFSTFSLDINSIPQLPASPRFDLEDLHKNAQAIDKPSVRSAVEDYKSAAPELNTKLLIDAITKKPHQPGVVYEIKVLKKRKRNLLGEYASVFTQKDQDGNYKINDQAVNEVKFIEVEVSPICDFAQKKWLKSRFISGILFKSNINPELKLKGADSDYIYNKLPDIKYGGSLWKIALDFRLLKALDIDAAETRGAILFRIKNDALTDVVTRMSSHASRIGITAVQ